MTKKSEAFPSEIADQVKQFHLNLISLKKELEPILDQLYDIKDDAAKDPIKSATLELTLLYLQTTGVDARSHSIGHELYRVEKYMLRLDLIKSKMNKPKLNVKAANAFVRNALWDENNQTDKQSDEPDVIALSDDDNDKKSTKKQKT